MLQIRRVSMPNQKPYAPSWTNHFLDWLNSLPIPIWLSIALNYLLAVIRLSFRLLDRGRATLRSIGQR